MGQKLCPESKPPFRTIGISGPDQLVQHPLCMDSISSERLKGETLRLLHDRPVPCVLRANLLLRTPGLKSPTPIVMVSCPYVSVKPLAELKLGVVFPALRTPWKTRCYQGMQHLAGQRSSSQRATPGTT